MPGNLFDLCDIAPQGSELRILVNRVYEMVPALEKEYIRCEDICFHDICVQDVLLIYDKNIDIRLPLPLPHECPGNMEFKPEESYVIVKCAKESLVGCSSVRMIVKYDVVVRGIARGKKSVRKCYVVWRFAEDIIIDEFYSFKTWNPVSGDELRDYLRRVDGSSIVVNLNCELAGEYVYVQGTIADKLWKNENLVVLAAKPYSGITINHEFKKTRVPECRSSCYR